MSKSFAENPQMDFAAQGIEEHALDRVLVSEFAERSVDWETLFRFVHQDTWFGLKHTKQVLSTVVCDTLKALLDTKKVGMTPLVAPGAKPTIAQLKRATFQF